MIFKLSTFALIVYVERAPGRDGEDLGTSIALADVQFSYL